MIGRRGRLYSDIREPGYQRGEIVTVVEAIGEPGEVARQILGIEGVTGSNQRLLYVAQHGVHPHEMPCLATLWTTAGDNRPVFAADVLYCPEVRLPIGVGHGSRLQMVLRPAMQILLVKV